jgi:hypothetical protein
MKKIINGKVYDTETAQEMGCWSNMSDVRNFHQFTETLYRKRTGEYFLHGEGGPMTQYARAVDTNSWTGGERIMPMTYQEAQKWAEEHLDGDEYEAIFGEIVEDDSTYMINAEIPAALAERLKRRAAESGQSMRDTLISILQAQL